MITTIAVCAILVAGVWWMRAAVVSLNEDMRAILVHQDEIRERLEEIMADFDRFKTQIKVLEDEVL